MKSIFLTFLFTPLILSARIQWSQEIPGGFKAFVQIPKTTATVQDDFAIILTLNYPKSYQPDVDTIRKNLLKYIGITEPPFALKRESIEAASGRQMQLTFFLEPQINGTQYISFYEIPFLPLKKGSDEKKHIISEIFKIHVNLADVPTSFKGNPAGLLSLTDPLPLQISPENRARFSYPAKVDQEFERSKAIISSRSFPFTQVLGIILFCVVLLIIRMQPKRKPDKQKEIQKQAANAQNKALLALQALDSANKEEYYKEITNTVRTFIEEKYQIKSTRQTTQEFLFSMTTGGQFDKETQTKLSDFLLSADRVKFAHHIPNENECLKAQKIAEEFLTSSPP